MCWCAEAGLTDEDVVVDGATVRVHAGGAGPSLVLLHGNPTHAFLFRHVLPHLTPRFRCLTVDLPGFGASSTQPGLTIAEHGRIVGEVVARLADGPVTWLAHDWGVATAFVASARVDRPHRVALCEGHVRWIPSWESQDPGFADLFRSLRTAAGVDFVVRDNRFVEEILLGSLPHLDGAEREAYRAPFADADRRHVVLALAREVPVGGEPADMAPVLADVERGLADPALPKLLLAARPGAVIDDEGRQWVVDRSRSLQVVDVGAGSHFLPEEQPRAIAEALLAWDVAG